jgi:hypothetical protein
MRAISNRVESRALSLAEDLTEVMLRDEVIQSLFDEWDEQRQGGSFCESLSEMISKVDKFSSDSDSLLEAGENDNDVVIGYWLIERAAFYGTRPQILHIMLRDEVKVPEKLMNTLYTVDMIEAFLAKNVELVRSRRFMLLKELEGSSVNLSKMIRERITEIDIILKGLVNDKDYKYYAQISTTWIKSLELLAKLLGRFENQTAQINIKTTNVQNFITINTILEDKINSLKDKIPKQHLDLIRKELLGEVQELYDITDEQKEYSLQKVG